MSQITPPCPILPLSHITPPYPSLPIVGAELSKIPSVLPPLMNISLLLIFSEVIVTQNKRQEQHEAYQAPTPLKTR